jgi:hypothetical protein
VLSDEAICGICIRYTTIETKEAARIAYNRFLGMVFIGNVKCVRIVGFQNIIRFFFITL